MKMLNLGSYREYLETSYQMDVLDPFVLRETRTYYVYSSSFRLPNLKEDKRRNQEGKLVKTTPFCSCSSMVELQLPKLAMRVRFSSIAPGEGHSIKPNSRGSKRSDMLTTCSYVVYCISV